MPSNSLAKWLFLIPSGRHITSREISGLAPTWKQNWSKDFLEKMQSSIEDQIPFSSQEMSHQNKCSSVTRWFYRRLLLWALALVQGDRLKYHHWSLGVLGFRVWGSVSSLPGEKKKGKTLQEGMVLTCTDSHGPQFLHGLVQESAAVCSWSLLEGTSTLLSYFNSWNSSWERALYAFWRMVRRTCSSPCLLRRYKQIVKLYGMQFGSFAMQKAWQANPVVCTRYKKLLTLVVAQSLVSFLFSTAGYSHISKLHLNQCLVMFLHTCACGWWRRLLKYPFDCENASGSFFQFPNCKGLLPLLAMSSCNGEDSLGGSAWSLIHLGNAEYSQPLVGLTQSGFFTKWSFLSPCNFVVVYLKEFTPDFLHTKEDAKPGIKVAATETEALASKPKLLLPRPPMGALESKQKDIHSRVYIAKLERRIQSQRWERVKSPFHSVLYGGHDQLHFPRLAIMEMLPFLLFLEECNVVGSRFNKSCKSRWMGRRGKPYNLPSQCRWNIVC